MDPVCISAIWLAGPDSEIYGWTGDIGASCGAQWYYSNAIVGIDGFQPPCVVSTFYYEQILSEDSLMSVITVVVRQKQQAWRISAWGYEHADNR